MGDMGDTRKNGVTRGGRYDGRVKVQIRERGGRGVRRRCTLSLSLDPQAAALVDRVAKKHGATRGGVVLVMIMRAGSFLLALGKPMSWDRELAIAYIESLVSDEEAAEDFAEFFDATWGKPLAKN